MKQTHVKAIGYVILAIIVLNLVLFAFRIIGNTIFWGIIILGALFAWKVLPLLNAP